MTKISLGSSIFNFPIILTDYKMNPGDKGLRRPRSFGFGFERSSPFYSHLSSSSPFSDHSHTMRERHQRSTDNQVTVDKICQLVILSLKQPQSSLLSLPLPGMPNLFFERRLQKRGHILPESYYENLKRYLRIEKQN